MYHVVWIVGQPFQATIIQPQDLDQRTALKAPVAVMVDTIFMIIMPSTIGMSSIPFLFEILFQFLNGQFFTLIVAGNYGQCTLIWNWKQYCVGTSFPIV